MPAPIDPETRRRIAFLSALGYSQRDIGAEVGVSRNTVRKYLELTRKVVEEADDPEETLATIVRGEYDWERQNRSTRRDFGDLPM